ncbi:hypothetical protein ACFQ0M_05675 [Kitasatospora aburaviensis]
MPLPRAPYTLHPLLESWYLDGRTGSMPPDAFWDALLAHADRGDLDRLARGARSLGADARAEELDAAAAAYHRHRYAQFVDSGEGVELAARPYFFLSYAHTPRAGAGVPAIPTSGSGSCTATSAKRCCN